MERQVTVWIVIGLVLVAGCSAGAPPTDEPTRNATLSLSGYERTADASPVDTRLFWDRTSNWEDPENRSVNVTSRVRTYRNLSGADTVVVYTTPEKPYVGADRIRPMSAAERARMATRSAEFPRFGNDTDRTYTASVLDRERTVQVLADPEGAATTHVTHVSRRDAVVVVVIDGADRSTVERVLGSVSFRDGTARTG